MVYSNMALTCRGGGGGGSQQQRRIMRGLAALRLDDFPQGSDDRIIEKQKNPPKTTKVSSRSRLLFKILMEVDSKSSIFSFSATLNEAIRV